MQIKWESATIIFLCVPGKQLCLHDTTWQPELRGAKKSFQEWFEGAWGHFQKSPHCRLEGHWGTGMHRASILSMPRDPLVPLTKAQHKLCQGVQIILNAKKGLGCFLCRCMQMYGLKGFIQARRFDFSEDAFLFPEG